MLQPEDKMQMAQQAFGVKSAVKTEPTHEIVGQE